MEADKIKQEPLLSITSEIEYHSNSDLLDLITPKIESIDDALKNYLVKRPQSNCWKGEPEDEDIKMASVKHEIFDETESFPGIKTEEVMIKSETENSDNRETGQNVAQTKEEVDKYDCTNSHYHAKTVTKRRNNSQYPCSHCDFVTHYRFSLQRHIVGVHKEGPVKKYSCDLCDYEAIEKRYLNDHVIARHDKTRQKRHVCNRCAFRTNYKRSLQSHFRAVHGPGMAKKHICSYCDYRTVSKFRLEAHVLVQHDKDGKKLLACAQCEFKTNYVSSLHNHLNARHNTDAAKMDTCNSLERDVTAMHTEHNLLGTVQNGSNGTHIT